jgi:mono/diheme cytochrome c family protein
MNRVTAMKVIWKALALISAVAAGASLRAGDPQVASGSSEKPAVSVAASRNAARAQAALTQYCLTCHNEKLRTAGMALTAADWNDIPGHAQLWEKVVRKLRTKTMPPANLPRPDQAGYDALASYIEEQIDAAAAAHPDPGHTEPVHRLNRTEYQNAIRDLLALDVDGSALLPADDQSYGFDNVAGVLKMSPTLLERYMGAAREISRLAVGTSKQPPLEETVRLRSDLSQYEQIEGLPFGTRGGAAVEYNFPQDGEYVIKSELLDLFAGAQVKELHQLEVSVDGERVKVFTLTPRRPPANRNSQDNKGQAAEKDKPSPDKPSPEDLQALGFGGKPPEFEVRVPVKAGPRVVTVTFVKKTSALSESVRQPFSRPHGEGDYLMYEPHLGTVTIVGPFNPQGAHNTPSRERIFTCYPSQPAQETACAKEILSMLARRAYRRPVGDAEVSGLLGFYNEGRAEAGFDAGIERALRAILVSPDFLYRVEMPSQMAAAKGAMSPLSDLELASRLSFFLWSSMPDDELIRAASQGKLSDPSVLQQEVHRMLKDERSAALAANFAGQWLRLRNVLGQEPDDVLFPNFNDNLRHDFVKETELFFRSIVKENRSVMDLLTADYSFMNERLAAFYGVPNVHGNYFRRVTLPDPNRRGLLGQASILMVTSYSDRTSPVGRGKWILENVLGAPPPPKPANVPDLKENGANGQFLSMRERMEQHRANPACAGCHARMDPVGYAMENFDAVGRWRTVAENGQVIDATGALPDGTKFNGPAELRTLLAKSPEEFITVVSEKLFVYALGRGLEYYDAPTIRQMVRSASHDNYSFESLVLALVKSTPYTHKSSPPLLTAKERGNR